MKKVFKSVLIIMAILVISQYSDISSNIVNLAEDEGLPFIN
ncbi:hypothetical protein ACFSCX_24045 [Bacillus salitolerans]|uniref:Uncharacterized protein n=1 Tax=Bacillus salitolerans TaxID=1437434 RepID=A0ABW4LZA6_9BACI